MSNENHARVGARAGSTPSEAEINLHFGCRLRQRRKLLGMTQTELASAIGVRFQQIQKYECAANRMSGARLWQVSKALEVPVTYFYEGLGSSKPYANINLLAA